MRDIAASMSRSNAMITCVEDMTLYYSNLLAEALQWAAPDGLLVS